MFHPVRKWRVDICWPDQKLALEIEGGIWVNGGHVRPAGFMKDLEKYNALTLEGYHLLRCTPEQIESCEIYDTVREWFKRYIKDGWKPYGNRMLSNTFMVSEIKPPEPPK